MRVAVLGPLTVEHDGQPVVIGGQRLRALFVRLALEPGRWVSAGSLLAALWDGDDGPTDPVNALQSSVSRLRRLLPDPLLLETSSSGYRLAVQPRDVDALRFEELADRGRAALTHGNPEEAIDALQAAHDLWRGPALADLDGSGFAQPYVSRLEERKRAADEDRYEAALLLGRQAEVIGELEAIVAAEPLREHAASQLIRALAAAGRQSDALAAYGRTRTALVEELGLDPSPELSAAHQSVLNGPPPPAPLTPQPSATRTNLPTALTSFVGRGDELDRLQQLLSTHRLVTLTGPGGAGKTRLAIAAGQRADDVPAGVWLVELAPVSDPDELAAAALGALSARETNLLEQLPPGGRDALSRLVDLLSGRRALLVLDNCEHLVEGAARLADRLLASCPLLRILATSREPLAIFGEAICPVLPLGMPKEGMAASQALQFPSVRLFADRAAAVSPGFAVDEQTVTSVIEICRRLDGLPLAIELAAARLRTLPVDVVAARLVDRFRLLTGGSRTAVARHQTLRSVVSWSWELMTDEERRLAESLAVFHGGVMVDSATAVSGTGPDETLELLATLADKSILQPVGHAMRWRMLETLREYGAERLSAQHRTDQVRAAHAEYFCSLVERCEPWLRGPTQMECVRTLSAERDNLTAALRFSIDSNDVATAVRFGAGLAWFWHLVGMEAEAAGWLNQILALPAAADQPGYGVAVVGWAFSLVGGGEWDQNKSQAMDYAAEYYRGAFGTGHPLLAMAEPGLELLLGDPGKALAAIERQMNHPDPWARAALQLVRGLIAENDGDLGSLRDSSARALEGFRAAGDAWGTAMALASSGAVAILDGELEVAIAHFGEAIDMLSELGSPDDVAYLLMRRALVRYRADDREGAAADLKRAHDLAEQRGSSSILAMTEFAMGQQLWEDSGPEEGRAFISAAIQRAERAPNVAPQALASMYCALAGIETSAHRLDDAVTHLTKAWKLALDSRDMPVVAITGVKIAELAAAEGEPALAARLLGASDSVRGAPDLSDPDAPALLATASAAVGELAEIELAAGRVLPREKALALLESRLR